MQTIEISVEYIDHMGSDLTVVNAARASFDKESDWDKFLGMMNKQALKPADANLIRYLATGYRTSEWEGFLDEVVSLVELGGAREELTKLLHSYKRRAQHWAPFAHPHVGIRMHLPIFLARQFVKHQIGGVWSEESRRYISDEPGVWFPDEWHSRPEDIKQGSGGLVAQQGIANSIAGNTTQVSLTAYDQLLGGGVAPEEARIVLPLNMMTTVVWTGSLLFWSRVCNQRIDSHAQLAAQELGEKITGIVAPLFPVSWEALTGVRNENQDQ